MTKKVFRKPSTPAILAMAHVQAAADGFNSGETNLFDALDAIIVAIEAYRAATQSRLEAA